MIPLRLLRLLSFRTTTVEFAELNRSDLYLGLVLSWIVGIGRYWDDPGATIFQHLGLGSVIYVFALSALLWAILLPFKVSDWRYERVLTFVALTSAPAIFYAIPVERFFSMELSARINAYFLLIVATWRVALLFFFLRQSVRLSGIEAFIGTFLPITFIVSTLTVLNLERAVFEIMGGIRAPTSRDFAYQILLLITIVSAVMFLPLLVGYVTCLLRRRRN